MRKRNMKRRKKTIRNRKIKLMRGGNNDKIKTLFPGVFVIPGGGAKSGLQRGGAPTLLEEIGALQHRLESKTREAGFILSMADTASSVEAPELIYMITELDTEIELINKELEELKKELPKIEEHDRMVDAARAAMDPLTVTEAEVDAQLKKARAAGLTFGRFRPRRYGKLLPETPAQIRQQQAKEKKRGEAWNVVMAPDEADPARTRKQGFTSAAALAAAGKEALPGVVPTKARDGPDEVTKMLDGMIVNFLDGTIKNGAAAVSIALGEGVSDSRGHVVAERLKKVVETLRAGESVVILPSAVKIPTGFWSKLERLHEYLVLALVQAQGAATAQEPEPELGPAQGEF
jgi:hypothetical protein